ncbi:unnamed protein product [Sphagnum troendelagicum]
MQPRQPISVRNGRGKIPCSTSYWNAYCKQILTKLQQSVLVQNPPVRANYSNLFLYRILQMIRCDLITVIYSDSSADYILAQNPQWRPNYSDLFWHRIVQ